MWLLKIPVTVVTVTQKVEAVNHATNRIPRAYPAYPCIPAGRACSSSHREPKKQRQRAAAEASHSVLKITRRSAAFPLRCSPSFGGAHVRIRNRQLTGATMLLLKTLVTVVTVTENPGCS